MREMEKYVALTVTPGCLNVFGMAAAVDGACLGFLGKAGTETLPFWQAC